MRKTLISLMIVLTLLTVTSVAYASPTESRNFAAILSGSEEVPPRETNAHGVATFKLNKEGTELGYTLIVANIENVASAHIHCGAVGANGPVGVTLFMGTPGGGRFDGVLAQGIITGPDAVNGCGWVTLDDVITAMRGGDTYVNVHTNDGIDPPNSGAGDFPGGEIRGQIE